MESLAYAALALEDVSKLGVDVTTLVLASKLVKVCLRQDFDIVSYFGNSNVGERIAKLKNLDEQIAKKKRQLDEVESEIFQRGIKLFELGVEVSEAGSLPQIRELKGYLASDVVELQQKIMELKGSLNEMKFGITTIVSDIVMPHLRERYFGGGQNTGGHYQPDLMLSYCAYLATEHLVDLVISHPEYYVPQLRKYASASPGPASPELTGSRIIRLRQVERPMRGITECKDPYHLSLT